ncbi:MAG: hypothetical protein HY303_22335 [Candidatus Wallbacteria bacterium]|nr:hypothetical protein [Candidatus Wallbacteria bacterium]
MASTKDSRAEGSDAMSLTVMTVLATGRPVSEQRRRRRSLLEEIQRIRENVGHRRTRREARERTPERLQEEARSNEVRVTQTELSDASSIRRNWQLRRKIARLTRFAALVIVVIALVILTNQRDVTATASRSTGGFLEAAAKHAWGTGRERFFSSWLKDAEPPDRFARDVQLLEAKLGRVTGFSLQKASTPWSARQCDLFYQVMFEKGEAQGYFELMQEDGRWVVDTFCFLAPRWKRL